MVLISETGFKILNLWLSGFQYEASTRLRNTEEYVL